MNQFASPKTHEANMAPLRFDHAFGAETAVGNSSRRLTVARGCRDGEASVAFQEVVHHGEENPGSVVQEETHVTTSDAKPLLHGSSGRLRIGIVAQSLVARRRISEVIRELGHIPYPFVSIGDMLVIGRARERSFDAVISVESTQSMVRRRELSIALRELENPPVLILCACVLSRAMREDWREIPNHLLWRLPQNDIGWLSALKRFGIWRVEKQYECHGDYRFDLFRSEVSAHGVLLSIDRIEFLVAQKLLRDTKIIVSRQDLSDFVHRGSGSLPLADVDQRVRDVAEWLNPSVCGDYVIYSVQDAGFVLMPCKEVSIQHCLATPLNAGAEMPVR